MSKQVITFTGRVTALGRIEEGTNKQGTAWKYQQVVIEELGEQYPNSIAPKLWNDKVGSVAEGDLATFTIDCRARAFTDRITQVTRWTNDLRVWKVEKEGATAIPQAQPQQQPQPAAQIVQQVEAVRAQAVAPQPYEQDDLPF